MEIGRRGVTLVEVLVVLAILAVLAGLILPAVQNVRAEARRTQSANQLRQLGLAMQDVAGVNNGIVGYAAPLTRPMLQGEPIPDGASPLGTAVGYLEPRNWNDNSAMYHVVLMPGSTSGQTLEYWALQFSLILSPADPTLAHLLPSPEHVTSYSWSFPVFVGMPKYPTSIQDGSTNTIVLAERYATASSGGPARSSATFGVNRADPPWISPFNNRPDYYTNRRATFADPAWADVHAVTTGTPAVTRPSVPGTTFQVRPQPNEANCHALQTPHAAGLVVAMGDGSVRTIHPSVAETTFWAAITPSAGDGGSAD